MSYCRAIETMPDHKKDLHKAYHDKHYGFPINDDNELFCRLVLEINQAGLSWETILRKRRASGKPTTISISKKLPYIPKQTGKGCYKTRGSSATG